MTEFTPAQEASGELLTTLLDSRGKTYRVDRSHPTLLRVILTGYCETSEDHSDGAAYLIRRSGWIDYKCHHDSCQGRKPDILRRLNNKRRSESGGSSGPDKVDQPFRLLSIGELRDRPRSPQLVEATLELNTTAGLIGESGSGKSLAALDMALSTACGIPTLDGRKTRQGLVVYVVGEGLNGIAKRIDGWKQARGIDIDPENFLLLIDPLILTGDCDRVLATLRQLPAPPVLVVIDTLNRTFAGDENSAGDMAAYIKAADRIKDEFGCCVLIVHHHGKDGRYRGSSAFKASLDTMLETERSGSMVRLSCAKQKDLEPFDPIEFRLTTVYLGFNADCLHDNDAPIFLSDLTTVVLEPVESRTSAEPGDRPPSAKAARLRIALLALRDSVAKWETQTAWGHLADLPPSTMSKIANEAVRRGFAELDDRGKGKPNYYRLTTAGADWLKGSERASEPSA
jgi:hypothetical protein